MKFIIRHDIKGRLRVHLMQESMTYRQADTLAYYLENVAGVTSAKVLSLIHISEPTRP